MPVQFHISARSPGLLQIPSQMSFAAPTAGAKPRIVTVPPCHRAMGRLQANPTGSSWKFQHLRYQSQHVSAIHVLCLLCTAMHSFSQTVWRDAKKWNICQGSIPFLWQNLSDLSPQKSGMVPRCRLSLKTSLYRTWGQKARISWCQGALGHETRVSFAEPTALLTPGGVSGEGYDGYELRQALHLSQNMRSFPPGLQFQGAEHRYIVGIRWADIVIRLVNLWASGMCIWGRLILVANDRSWRITPPINQGLLENPVALHDYPTSGTHSVRFRNAMPHSAGEDFKFIPSSGCQVIQPPSWNLSILFVNLERPQLWIPPLFGRHMTSVAGTCWLGPYSNPGTPSGVAYHALNWNWRTTRFEGNSCRHSFHEEAQCIHLYSVRNALLLFSTPHVFQFVLTQWLLGIHEKPLRLCCIPRL